MTITGDYHAQSAVEQELVLRLESLLAAASRNRHRERLVQDSGPTSAAISTMETSSSETPGDYRHYVLPNTSTDIWLDRWAAFEPRLSIRPFEREAPMNNPASVPRTRDLDKQRSLTL
jgi:hypothetical protein